MIPTTVSIVDVIPDATGVRADHLQPGDELFDYYGGRHELSDVKVYKRHVATIRTDGWVDRWDRWEIVAAVVKSCPA